MEEKCSCLLSSFLAPGSMKCKKAGGCEDSMMRLKDSPGTPSCFGPRHKLKSFKFREFFVRNVNFEEMILNHIEKNTKILWTKKIQVVFSMPRSGVLNVAK